MNELTLHPAGWANGEGHMALMSALSKWREFARPSYHQHCEDDEIGCACCSAQQDALAALAALRKPEALLVWAKDVMRHAALEERNPPDVRADLDAETGRLELLWAGTFTAGRWYRAIVWTCAGNEEWGVRIEWESATGRMSRYLDIERVIGAEGWHDSGPL